MPDTVTGTVLDPEAYFTFDASENRAIAQLLPALDAAVRTGNASDVVVRDTAKSRAELVAIAIRLCKQSGSNVAVVQKPAGRELSFVPLFATASLARTQVRLTSRPAAPPPYRAVPLAAAGATVNI